ncbi:MAG: hypothetical protein ACE1Z9_00460, partial [Acidimicrobiia bacterium]
GQEFHMRAFSGEVAKHIASFNEDVKDSVPTIYKMLEEICELNEQMLVKPLRSRGPSGEAAGAGQMALRKYSAIRPLSVRSLRSRGPSGHSQERDKWRSANRAQSGLCRCGQVRSRDS